MVIQADDFIGGGIQSRTFAFQLDGKYSRFTVLMKNQNPELRMDNILTGNLLLRLYFDPSSKTRPPFIEDGKFSLFLNGVEKKTIDATGLITRLDLNLHSNPHETLSILRDMHEIDFALEYDLQFYSADVSTKSDRQGRIDLNPIIWDWIRENTEYYFLDFESLIPVQFEPGKRDRKRKNMNQFELLPSHISRSKKLDYAFATKPIKPNNLILNAQTNHLSASLWSNLTSSNKRNVPKVDDPRDRYFPDYERKNFFWVKPSFLAVSPTGGISIENSPFTFEMVRSGLNVNGQQALTATIKLRIKTYLNTQDVQDIPQNSIRKLVERSNIDFRIKLPYLNSNNKNSFTYLKFTSIQTQKEYTELECTINDEWVRLFYAAISTPAVESDHRPELSITYYCQAMMQKAQEIPTLATGVLSTNTSRLDRRKSSDAQVKVNRIQENIPRTSRKIHRVSKKVKPILAQTTFNLNSVSRLEINPILINAAKKKKYISKKIKFMESVKLYFPCDQFGDYFVEKLNNINQSIGCQEPLRLGQIRTPLFTRISDLDHRRYSVYRSTVMTHLFIVVPKQYIIARRLEEPEKFAPEISLHGAVDIEALEESHCVINFMLEPDMTFYQRMWLENELTNYTAVKPVINYINEFPGEETISWNMSEDILQGSNILTFEHIISGSFLTNIMNAQICKTILETSGISGTYTKKLDEDLEIESQLKICTSLINEPWNGEAIIVEKDEKNLHLINQLESNIHLDRLEAMDFDPFKVIPVQREVLGHGQISVPFYQELLSDKYIPVFSSEINQQTLSENYSYIEDLFQQIICIDLFSSSENGLLLEVQVGCMDQLPYTKMDFGDGSKEKESYLMIPINEVIHSTSFGFICRYLDDQNNMYETNWIPYSFSQQGNIISITKNIINQ